MIICNLLYIFLKFFFELPDKSVIVFDSFSYQYLGIIMAIISFTLFLIKDFGVLIKISQYGIFLIFLTILYLIFKGIYNLACCDINFNDIPLATNEFTNLFGIFLIAFCVHHIINQIMKKNSDSSNNERDLKIGFIVAAILYALLGVFGAFAIRGIAKQPGKSYNIVFDFLEQNTILACFEFVLFLYLTSLLPILW